MRGHAGISWSAPLDLPPFLGNPVSLPITMATCRGCNSFYIIGGQKEEEDKVEVGEASEERRGSVRGAHTLKLGCRAKGHVNAMDGNTKTHGMRPRHEGR